MIATLKFKLPEDQHEYDVIMQAKKMQTFLLDFSQQLRSWRKYHNDFENNSDALEKITEEFYKLINDNGINIDL